MTGKPIHELSRSECRYPITPDSALKHFFCAEPVEGEGIVYCAKHAKLCYDRRPAERRRADAERAANARGFRMVPGGFLANPRTLTAKDRIASFGGATREDLP